jgi:hypothetical protein
MEPIVDNELARVACQAALEQAQKRLATAQSELLKLEQLIARFGIDNALMPGAYLPTGYTQADLRAYNERALKSLPDSIERYSTILTQLGARYADEKDRAFTEGMKRYFARKHARAGEA